MKEERIILSGDEKNPVTLVGDDEFLDRCFLVIGPRDNPTAHLTLAGTNLADIAKALGIAKKELEE